MGWVNLVYMRIHDDSLSPRSFPVSTLVSWRKFIGSTGPIPEPSVISQMTAEEQETSY